MLIEVELFPSHSVALLAVVPESQVWERIAYTKCTP